MTVGIGLVQSHRPADRDLPLLPRREITHRTTPQAHSIDDRWATVAKGLWEVATASGAVGKFLNRGERGGPIEGKVGFAGDGLLPKLTRRTFGTESNHSHK